MLHPITILKDAQQMAFLNCNVSATVTYTASTILNHAIWHVMHPELMERPNGITESSVNPLIYGTLTPQDFGSKEDFLHNWTDQGGRK